MPTFDLLSREERNLYNPAFTALLIARTVQGFEQNKGHGLHLLLGVISPVMALTPQVRTVLPKTTGATTVNWIEREAEARVHLGQAAPALGPIVREGLRLGLQTGTFVRDGPLLYSSGTLPARISGGTTEVVNIQRAAHFLGRWLPKAGDLPTIFTLLGVRP